MQPTEIYLSQGKQLSKKWAQDLNSKRRNEDGQGISLKVFREKQITVILEFHLTPRRVAKMKKTAGSKGWRRHRESEIFIHCW